MLKKSLIIVILVLIVCGISIFVFKDSIKAKIKQNPELYGMLKNNKAKMSQFLNLDSGIGNLNKNELMKEAEFYIDFTNELGKLNKFWQGLGHDSFKDGTLKPYNRAYFNLIGEMNKVRPVFQSAHSKGMLSDKWHIQSKDNSAGHVYKELDNKEPIYNWQIVDEVFDLFLSNNLKPLVSFTYMPSAIASRLKKKNPWSYANVSPPNDYEKWQEIIFNVVDHLKTRYGSDEISQWYFEVWNEPDLPHFFWIDHPNKKRYPYRGNNKEYFKLYDYSIEGAIAAEKRIKIGGPAIAGDIELFINRWFPHLVSGKNFATGEKGTRIDFLSRHCYGNIEDKILNMIKMFVDGVKRQNKTIANSTDFIITEYGPSTLPKPWLNTRYVASWVVKLVDGILYLGDREGKEYIPDMMYFWTLPIPPNFDKHFGLATAFGNKNNPSPRTIVKRPVFNAFDALSRLDSTQVKVEGTSFGDPLHAIATKSGDESIHILLYHIDENDRRNNKKQSFPIKINIKNLPFETFKSELFVIDEDHSNGFSLWRKMGSPKPPTSDQIKKLQQQDDLDLVERELGLISLDRSFEKEIKLQNNSVALLSLIASNVKGN